MGLSSIPEKRAAQLKNLKSRRKGDSALPNAGRPRNMFSEAVAQMEKEVGQIPTRDDIIRSLFFCVSAGEDNLKKWVGDKNQPMLVRICAKEVLGGKGFEAIGKILDRVVGRTIDVTTNGKDIKQEQLIIEVIDDKSQVRAATEE